MAVTAPTLRRPGGALGAPDAPPDEAPTGVGPDSTRAGAALLGGLLVALLYAAFAHGAASYPHAARLQAGLCVLAALALGALLWRGDLRLSGSPAGWAALGLLAAFAAWTGLSLAWSVAPSGTWVELNRAIAYVLILALAMTAASWYPRAISRAAIGYAGIALLVAVYALGGKVAPGIHVGPVDLNQTAVFARLRAPLEYWNAVALFVVMAVPVALRLAVDETRSARLRLGALVALPVYLVTLGLTFSRGGVIAAVAAIAVTIVLAGSALRTLMYLALALAAAAPALVIGYTTPNLTGLLVPLSRREEDGLVLGLVLLGCLAVLALVGRAVLSAEVRTAPNAARSRLIGRVLVGAVGVALVAGVVAMGVSHRGLAGTISHQWDTFRSPHEAPSVFDPGRIASTNSGNRWVWWSEAVGAWSDRPLEGHGAGSFPVVHRQYRTDRLNVLQPHSVPLQFLAETGLVGFALATGALLLLMLGAVGVVRRLVPGRERGLAAALLGASAAWLVHASYDWDWDIPGVTLPALAFMGVLCGRGRGWSRSPRALGPGARGLLLAGATLALGSAALSAILPSWARSKTDGALASVARTASPARLQQAQADADFASRLDTLSVEPLLAAASLATRRGRSTQARQYLIDAVRRQPSNAQVWLSLSRFELDRGDLRNARTALRRVVELDPRNPTAPVLIAAEQWITVPATESATATGTPLVAVVGQTPATAKLLVAQLQSAGQPVPDVLRRLAARAP